MGLRLSRYPVQAIWHNVLVCLLGVADRPNLVSTPEAIEAAQSRANDIPPEIIDRIVSYFHHSVREDRSALLACSLVARPWLEVSRRRYFYRLLLSTLALNNLLHIPLLDPPNRSLPQHVRELVITELSQNDRIRIRRLGKIYPNFAFFSPPRECNTSKWAKVLSPFQGRRHLTLPMYNPPIINESFIHAFPSLDTLVITTTQWLSTTTTTPSQDEEILRHHSGFERSPTPLPTHRPIHLKLVNVHFPIFESFTHLIESLPLLTLSANQVSWTPSIFPAKKPCRRIKRPLRISELELNDKNALDLVEWMFTRSPTPTVNVLYFHGRRLELYTALQRLFEVAGVFIQELKFDVTFTHYPGAPVPPYVIPNFALLKYLQICHVNDIIVIRNHPITTVATSWIIRFLSQLRVPLKELRFTILITDYDDLELLAWPDIKNALSRVKVLTSRTRLRFRVSDVDSPTDDTRAQAEATLQNHFPEFQKQGLLAIEFFAAD